MKTSVKELKDKDLDEMAQFSDASASLGRLFQLVKPYVGALSVISLLMMLGTAISMIAPKVAGDIVDTAISSESLNDLNEITLMLIGLFAVMAVLSFITTYWLKVIGAKFLRNLREQLFSHLLGLPAAFYQKRQVGELNARIVASLNVVQQAVTEQIPMGVQAVVRLIGTLSILLFLHTELTLVAMAVIPPIIILGVVFGKRLEKVAESEQDSLADSAANTEEVLSGIQTVKSFNCQQYEKSKYQDFMEKLFSVQVRGAKFEGAFGAFIQLIGFSGFAVVLWYGGRLMVENKISAGDLTAFLLYTSYLAISIGLLSSVFAHMKELVGASKRIYELLDEEPEIRTEGTLKASIIDKPEIQFERIKFSYNPDANPLFNEFSLNIQSGQTLALIGPSGSGKSTLFSLLMRFYDVNEGVISIDGNPIQAFELHDLRSIFGVVSQDVFLFSGSVLENIRYGSEHATEEDVIAAAKAVGAHEFIEQLPNGYGSEVGQRGSRLSGGQKQRIGIARAYLKNPKVLLLDEATSALDADSEVKVQQAINVLKANRTTIIIAHRMSTVHEADSIAVIQNGEFVAQGTHEKLMQSNEIYQRYWKLQVTDVHTARTIDKSLQTALVD